MHTLANSFTCENSTDAPRTCLESTKVDKKMNAVKEIIQVIQDRTFTLCLIRHNDCITYKLSHSFSRDFIELSRPV